MSYPEDDRNNSRFSDEDEDDQTINNSQFIDEDDEDDEDYVPDEEDEDEDEGDFDEDEEDEEDITNDELNDVLGDSEMERSIVGQIGGRRR